ncbi:MAG: putative multidrug-efflux transporter [Firmicutes bacterium ADurb.Bin153]|nr:MAG: putative multidrug-efflux transporter [Firmicutes bacterium ADurb.Bin153]
MKNPLINKDFALLAIGQFVSSVGDNVHRVALVWWVYNVTGSPSVTGMLSLASMIPAIVLSPYMGVLADKWDRRKIVYGMDYLRGAIIAAIAALSFTGRLEVWHMVVSSVLVSACSSLFNPAVTAMMPGLVGMDRMQKAQGAFNTLMGLVGIIGPAVGGALVATVGYSMAFLLNAISFALSALSEMFIEYKTVPVKSDKGNFTQMLEAMKFTFAMPTIMGILLVFSMMNFSISHMGSITIPYLVKDVLAKGSRELGYTMTSISVGGILGSMLMGAVGNPKRRSVAITVGGALLGGFLVSWLLMPRILWLYFVMAVVGFSASIININAGVLFVKVAPDEMLGKLSAFMGTVSGFMSPVGLSLFSLLAATNKSLVFYFPAVSGFLILFFTFGLFLIRGYRDI